MTPNRRCAGEQFQYSYFKLILETLYWAKIFIVAGANRHELLDIAMYEMYD